MKKYFSAFFIVAILASVLFISCKKSSKSDYVEGVAETGDWLIVRLQAEPDTFNPATTQSTDGDEIGDMLVYESLIGLDNTTLLDVPSIADTLPDISADHLQYTYHLNKNAKFSDGVGVTGNDFICFIKTVKNPLIINAAPKRSYLQNIQKVELVNNDPYTIRFTLNEPYFLASQICGSTLALPKHVWDPNSLTDKYSWDELASNDKMMKNPSAKEYADWYSDPAKSRDPKFLIGSGKYIFDSWETAQRITFHRNPNYWNANGKNGQAYVDKIIYKIITDENAALTALKGGEIDFMPNVPKYLYFNAFDSVKNKDIAHLPYDYPNMSYIGWNLHNPLFQDVHVRLALAKLVNTDEIIHTLLKGMARPITGGTFFHRPEYDTTIQPITFDPDGAAKLLEDAGWKAGSDGILMKNGQKFQFSILTVSGSEISDKIMLIPVEAMRKAGISVELQHLEWSVFLQNVRSHKFDAVFSGWGTQAVEGDEYQTWHSSQTVGGSNSIFYNNPEVDSLIVADRGEFDFAKRVENHKRIQRLIFNDQPYAFLYSVKLAGAWNNRIHNVKFYPPRPCYDLTEWFVPKAAQKYGKNESASK